MRSFDCVERPLSMMFYRYGRFVSKHPLPFILLPLLFTIAMSTGFLHMDPISDAVYLFTPTNARSKYERQTVHDLWPLENGNYIPGRAVTQTREIQVTVRAKDDGNILQKDYADAVDRLDKFIQNVIVEFEGQLYGYKDLCLGRSDLGCPANKHIQMISKLYQRGYNLTYPTVEFGKVRGYIGSSLGGVKVFDDKDGRMILAGAKSWLMVYHLQFHPEKMFKISGLWEKAFEDAIKNYPEDPHISITYFHSQTLAEELKRNADSLIPRFVLSFTVLMFFSVLCSISTCDGSFYIDWVLSKPILAMLGVANAGMGILTAIGMLNLTPFPYNEIIGVMPFLVVAVGVDNMFLMLSAMRRTNRALSNSRRMGEAMSNAAISMLITALTDALCFGVGAITTIPAVQIFCVYTCAAITFTFIYQMTFFAGLMALAIKWERKGLHCITLQPTVPADSINDASLFDRLFKMGSRADSDVTNVERNLKESNAALFFQNWFGPVLMQPVVKCLVVLWFLIYMAFAVYGCMQLREGLEPVNLLVQDSYAIPHYRALERDFWRSGAVVQIVVNNAPDLRDPIERLNIKKMVESFTNTSHTIGMEAVQFWMFEMELYYNNEAKLPNVTDDVTNEYYNLVRYFFVEKSDLNWPFDVKWTHLDNGDAGIKAFRFLVGLKNISTSVNQQRATALLREVAATYPQYNITTFMPLWLFTDQYALVVPNTIQNIVIAMAVMIVIALILIPQPTCALWVALAIASIDAGVIGYMTLWGVNLDAISMITIIMSIGFSVDYTAHITYGYVISEEKNPTNRIREALGALGWPLTQGALSTILAVIVLADVPAYMIVTFFKTVFLAIALGLLHGLIFLPVTLSLCMRGSCIADAPDKLNFYELNYSEKEREKLRDQELA